MRAREQALDERESQTLAREQAVDLRDRAVRAVAEADEARRDRERLMEQLREANERLVLASLHADELATQAGVDAAQSPKAEAERRRHAELLVTQLLASENALRASELGARATIRSMDEFFAMLAHELRNPLAAIFLALDFVKRGSEDPHKREHSIIERQASQLVRLVEDLLDVSRISSGKIVLRREPVEATDLVSRAVETAGSLIESQRHALTIDVPQHGLTIDGDVQRLTQVVGNLLTNAAKYTPSGGTIEVRGERHGDRVVLRVRDTGIGISEAMLPRIFDVFAQEHQRPGHAPGGLGLGLTIVRSLVELHGGTVTAHSAGLGHGSEFVVELPACGGRSDEASHEPAPEITPLAPSSSS